MNSTWRRAVVCWFVIVAVQAPLASAQQAAVFPGVILDLPASSPMMPGDVNLDGLPDILGIGSSDVAFQRDLEVLLAQPAGGFALSQSLQLSKWFASDIDVGDVDGNGWPDVAVLLNQTVDVFYGQGGGQLSPPSTSFLGSLPVALQVQDMNGDGRADLITAASTPVQLQVFLSKVAGGFLPATGWPAGLTPTDLDVGDIDLDGSADVVACGLADGALAVALGNGNGGLLAPAVQPTASAPRQVLLASLDGDADLDLVVVASESFTSLASSVATFLSGAAGLVPHASATSPPGSVSARIADVEGDGDLDVVTISEWVGQFGLFVNDGAGTLAAAGTVDSGSLNATDLLVLNATSDGLPDLACMDYGGLALRAATGPGAYAGSAALNIDFVRDVQVGFLDGDAWPDYVTKSGDSGQVLAVSLGSQDGFSAPTFPSSPWSIVAMRLGEMDGDGRVDLVTTPHNGGGSLSISPGTGTGGFGAPQIESWTTPSQGFTDLELADLDADGWLDVVQGIASASASGLLVHRNTGAGAPGTLLAPQLGAMTDGPVRLACGDLDADGLVDALSLCWLANQSSTLAASLGTGSGAMHALPAQLLPGADAAQEIALADMDLDGFLDGVVGLPVLSGVPAAIPGRVLVARGDGAGGFLLAEPVKTLTRSDVLTVGDVNGDGWPDVLTAGIQEGGVTLLRGAAGGALGAPQRYAHYENIWALRLVDANLDLRPDLVTVDNAYDTLAYGYLRAFDNIATPFAWMDLGHGLGGGAAPVLAAAGDLLPLTSVRVVLREAPPFSPVLLLAGATEALAPFKGGVLVPHPDLLIGLATDAAGRFVLDAPWPAGLPAGLSFSLQCWMAGIGPHGWLASNALRATLP